MFQTTNQLLFVPFCSDPSFVLKKQKQHGGRASGSNKWLQQRVRRAQDQDPERFSCHAWMGGVSQS